MAKKGELILGRGVIQGSTAYVHASVRLGPADHQADLESKLNQPVLQKTGVHLKSSEEQEKLQ